LMPKPRSPRESCTRNEWCYNATRLVIKQERSTSAEMRDIVRAGLMLVPGLKP
jgi:hypothetical protein